MGHMETGEKRELVVERRTMVTEDEKTCPSCGFVISNKAGFKNIDKMVYCLKCGAKL
jgi:transposase